MPDLKNRTAVITGASRGLGFGLAEAFLGRGMNVVVCARSAPPFEGSSVLSLETDVSDGDAVAAMATRGVERFGRIDLWINNAGLLGPIAALRNAESGEFRRHLEVNILGVFHGSKAFVRHVRERGGEGTLINISSGAARSAYSGWSAYCAGKAAVDRMTECIALEEKESGLRAYSVAPGIIDTEMQAMIRGSDESDFPMKEKFVELKERDAFSSPDFIAAHFLELAFAGGAPSSEVCISLPLEKS